MSALPPKADIEQNGGNVRFVPIADMIQRFCSPPLDLERHPERRRLVTSSQQVVTIQSFKLIRLICNGRPLVPLSNHPSTGFGSRSLGIRRGPGYPYPNTVFRVAPRSKHRCAL
jgi:hypothetical protein